MLSKREIEVVERHTAAQAEAGERVPQWEGFLSVRMEGTGRLWVHNDQPRRQAIQELVFHSVGSVSTTLTCSHTLKFWDLKRPATPRETARLQGFPETFRLPPTRYNRLIANAVAVPCATHALSCLQLPVDEAISHIDLCAGIGGFTFAGQAAGLTLECVGYSEIMPAALKCYKLNFPECPALGDATTVSAWPTASLLTAGFPCQPFSKCNSRLRRDTHEKRDFFEVVLHAIQQASVQYIVLENVPTLMTSGVDKFEELKHGLKSLGFQLDMHVLNAREFGLPQSRKRLYIIGRRDGKPMRPLNDYVPTPDVPLRSILEGIQRNGLIASNAPNC